MEHLAHRRDEARSACGAKALPTISRRFLRTLDYYSGKRTAYMRRPETCRDCAAVYRAELT